VEVLSILEKVKNAKKGNFYPNCINGLTKRLIIAHATTVGLGKSVAKGHSQLTCCSIYFSSQCGIGCILYLEDVNQKYFLFGTFMHNFIY
jgi:hypothetical protein